jgi:hypothetical protein
MSEIKIVNTNPDTDLEQSKLNGLVFALNEYGIEGILDFSVKMHLIELSALESNQTIDSPQTKLFYYSNLVSQIEALRQCRDALAKLNSNLLNKEKSQETNTVSVK